MRPVEAEPVKLFFGVLFSDEGKLEDALREIVKRYGPIDYRSGRFPFDKTDYYVSEMGTPIIRFFISLEKMIQPQEIARIKLESNTIEDQLSIDGHRKVNLDPGYLDYDKAVLASAKYNGDKIYLDGGIWADLTLRFKNGKFEPYPWSFPDFKTGLYDNVFVQIRNLYKSQRRTMFGSGVI